MISTAISINIKEDRSNYKIEVPAPGIKKEDFNIYTEGNKLIISCKSGASRTADHAMLSFWQKANDDSYFFRFLSLPDNADSSKITAKYNGVLQLRIPKKSGLKKK